MIQSILSRFFAGFGVCCRWTKYVLTREVAQGLAGATFLGGPTRQPIPAGIPAVRCPVPGFRVLKVDKWLLPVLVLTSFVTSSHAHEAGPRESLIKVSSERNGDTTLFYIENLQYAPVTVTFEVESKNMIPSTRLPHTATYPPRQKTQAFSLSPKEVEKGWHWSYTYYSTLGSLEAVHDDTVVYSMPYAPGQAFVVSQGFDGKYSHFGPNQYAIDWRMPIGTPIHAARGGLVVGSKDDSTVGGPDSKYDWDANYVLIQHDDGTLGQYVHLMANGNRVNIGQRVQTGELIGHSGNTGHSTGPHLHFAVFKARDGRERLTIPIRYKASEGHSLTLKKGRSYTASALTNTIRTVKTAPGGHDAVGAP
jgi:murein DD-endopeptidase MepM/ murein hydrolase activator NlpD